MIKISKWLFSRHLLMFLIQLFIATVGWSGYFLTNSLLGVFIFLFYSLLAAFSLTAMLNCTKDVPCKACKALKDNL